VRALGIDYGERRIGLALSDPTGLLASPWKTIDNDRNVGAAAKRIAEEVRALAADDDGLGAIVIGLPRRLSGEPNDLTPRVQTLATLLANEVVIPITLQDERLTSHDAGEILAQREHDWRKRKRQLDAMAAALILQDFLDHQPRQASAGAVSAEPTASTQRGGDVPRGPTDRSK
jgi:putative pre-16S rRNA nuclease